jgi:anti-sigma-K factor RskA
MEDLDREWELLLAGYAMGDLTPEEMVRVETLLSQRPELIAEVEKLQATLDLIPLTFSNASVPNSLRDRLIFDARSNINSSPQKPWWQPQLIWGTLGTAAAAAIAVLGWHNYQLSLKLAAYETELKNYQQTIALLSQPNNHFLPLKGMSPKSSSSGSLLIASEQNKGVLTIQNLPSLPQERIYRLWAEVNGRKFYCAQFMPDAKGKVLIQVPLEKLMEKAKFTVTIEPTQANSMPTGAMVMTTQI